MRKLITFLVLSSTILNSIAFSYASNDTKTINYLINYVNVKSSDIEKMQKKYNLEGDEDIKQRLKKLEEVKNILTKTSKTWEYNSYIPKIVEQLKENNTKIKEQLKEKIEKKKQEADKYKLMYYKNLIPVINKINNITINIAKKLVKKENYNSKDKQIIAVLILIKQRLAELEKLSEKSFNTKKDLKEYLMSNFKQITNNFRQIKNIVKGA